MPVLLGNRDLSAGPLVVGTVSTLAALHDLGTAPEIPADSIEFRLDDAAMNDAEIAAGLDRLRSRKVPVFLTIRIKTEGGFWAGTEAERLARFAKFVPHVDGADVEIASELLASVTQLFTAAGKPTIASCHDFKTTPAITELRAAEAKARAAGAAVFKTANAVHSRADVYTLLELLRAQKPGAACVIGMGPLGVGTRYFFPTIGSCLTYGYLDRPTAPGQPGARELKAHLGPAPRYAP